MLTSCSLVAGARQAVTPEGTSSASWAPSQGSWQAGFAQAADSAASSSSASSANGTIALLAVASGRTASSTGSAAPWSAPIQVVLGASGASSS